MPSWIDLPWAKKALKPVAALALACTVAACLSIGEHKEGSFESIDFGPRETVRFCVLRDADVSEKLARRLLVAVDTEFDRYGIDVDVPWVREWTSDASDGGDILETVASQPLEPPCDRLVALVGQGIGDTLWGLLLPEIVGQVETVTHTRGFVVATEGSIAQMVAEPEETMVHEAYHFLGCGHDHVMTNCYRRIADMKTYARVNKKDGESFFPGISGDGWVIKSRAEADLQLKTAIEALSAKRKKR